MPLAALSHQYFHLLDSVGGVASHGDCCCEEVAFWAGGDELYLFQLGPCSFCKNKVSRVIRYKKIRNLNY